MQLNAAIQTVGSEVIVPSAAITATAAGATFSGYRNAESLAIQVDVTAASGTTPTLDVKLQESHDGTNWFDVPSAAATQLTAAGHALIKVDLSKGIGNYIRAYYTLAGTTPNFTFSVTAYAKAKATY